MNNFKLTVLDVRIQQEKHYNWCLTKLVTFCIVIENVNIFQGLLSKFF